MLLVTCFATVTNRYSLSNIMLHHKVLLHLRYQM